MDEIAEEYKSSLSDLNFNSKPLINMLTMLAEENKKHAPLIVKTIVDHINSVSIESKLPGLYLVDSIIKNLGAEYLKIFSQHITSLFTSVFEKVDENTRSLMFKLRQTWTDIIPNKMLYSLDVSVKKLDPAWPVTAKNPTKRILINPKFLDGPSEEKKVSDVPPTSLQKEEDKIKQKQGEVLKQLLAKQEQLKQLEKKRQMSLQNKIVPLSAPSNPFKQNIFRDPRMVKINNVSQPASKPDVNPIAEQKIVPKLELTPVPSNVSSIKKPNIPSKAPVQSNLDSKSSIDRNPPESSVTNHMNQISTQEKVTLKNKSNKCFPKKSKSPTTEKVTKEKVDHKDHSTKEKIDHKDHSTKEKVDHKDHSTKEKVDHKDHSAKEKVDHKVKSNFEKLTDSFKSGDKTTKSDFSSNKSSENTSKEHSKAPKNSPKKKNVSSPDSNKTHQTEPNPPYALRRKVNLPRIPKKSDRLKCSTNIDSSNSSNEVNNKTVNKPYRTFPETNYAKHEDKFAKHKSGNIRKKPSVKTKEFSKRELVDNRVHSDVSNVKSIAQKDEDLRISSVPLTEEITHPKVPKRDMPVSHSSEDIEKAHPPRKKMKSEDIENRSPDYRDESPVLFGSEDQDLRHSNPPTEDITSKDWRQYKATHPDEFSPLPRQDSFQGRFRFRRHSTDFQHHRYPPDFDRNDSFRYYRGRYFPKRGVHRSTFAPHFPRGNRGRWLYNSHIDSVMFNSHAYLQQAEERFRSGRISETEYMDLRRDLQKMVESSEYKVPKMMSTDHHPRIPEFQNFEEYEQRKQHPLNNLKIQRPSPNPPSVKPFVLDGKERLIHYIDDKAIVLMDNNEPRELTFMNEPRDIFIEGMAKPLTLDIDGKSAEFELEGRRHIIRFGTPGRELYVNNHPYEAKFGGPPIAAMLADGCVYKIHVSGPNPQVVIGDKPLHELFAKFNNNIQGLSVKEEMDVDPAEERVKSEPEPETVAPPSSVPLQDVDMRVKLENIQQPDSSIDKDSPFYSEDMKDVDWRYIPSSSNLEPDKEPLRIHHENISDDFEKWTKNSENSSREPFHKQQNNQLQTYMPKEPPPPFEWKKPQLEKYPPATVENRVAPEQYPPAPVDNRNPVVQYAPAQVDNRVPPEQFPSAPVDNRIPSEQYTPAPLDNRVPPEQYLPPPLDNRFPPRQYPPAPLDNRVPPASSSHDSWYKEEQSRWQKRDFRENNQLLNRESTVYQQPSNNTRQQFQGNERYTSNLSHSYRPYNQRPPFRSEQERASGPRHGSWAPNFHRGGIRHNFRASINPPPRFPPPRKPGLLPPPPLPPSFPSFRFSAAPEADENAFKAPVEIQNEQVPGITLPSDPSATEAMSTESESNEVKVDVNSLLQKLMAAGIINVKPEQPEPMPVETSTSETEDTKEDETVPEDIPEIHFTPESLKEQHAGVISVLHSGLQCATCGMRYKDKQGDQYSRHLDWHFRMNRREKDGAKKAVSRRWYYEIEDWIQFEEFEDFEERVPSYFELQADTSQPDEMEVPVIVSVPTTSDDEESCPVCKERFQLFWVEEEEEWHYRDAVRHDNITYHPACYEDFKKASEADRSLKEENLSFDLSELEEEVTDVLNTTLDVVCKITEMKDEPLDVCETTAIKSEPLDECERTEIKTECPDTPEASEEVPSNEAHVEEEVLLEGKPGEEEIIGLILDSDMETDTDTTAEPKEESKMVVMQSGGITLKVKAESLQCHSPSNSTEKEAKSEDKTVEDEEIEFRPPTPDPNFDVRPPVKKGRELSGLCTIM